MNFINYWLNKYDDEVVNLDKQTYASNNPRYMVKSDKTNYSFVKGSICDRVTVDKLVKDVDCVVNFAAETHVDNSIANSVEFVRTNVEGTLVVLDAVKKYEKRLHHVSTDEVFGSLEIGTKGTFNEKSCYKPKNPYSATKAAADHLVNSYINTYGIRATISNCSNNYGPLQHPEKLIPRTILRLLNGEKAQLYGKGNQIRDWIYVLDHCNAIDLIVRDGKIGETYLVGTRNEKTNFEVVSEVIKLLGLDPNEKIEFVRDRPGHDERYAIDPSKIENELGWTFSHTFADSLKATVDFYKNNTGYFSST